MKTIFAFLAFLWLTPAVLAAPVTVRIIHADGWNRAYCVSNGVVDLVVVPGIGRIVSFALTGHPETNPIYTNAAEYGQGPPASVPFPKNEINFGGAKIWPSQQSDWPQHQPTGWPPDPSIESGPYRVTILRDGLRLTGPVSPYFHLRAIQEITLAPHAAQVNFRVTFAKSPHPSGPHAGFLVGIWSIAPTRGDGTVFLPVMHRGAFPKLGYNPFNEVFKGQPQRHPDGDLLQISRDPNVSTKTGSDSPLGWLATVYAGNLVFSQHAVHLPETVYPDDGCSAEVYTNPGTESRFIEMEVLGPMTHLSAGQHLVYRYSWHLQHLPRRPASTADAEHLVTALMKR
jgi:hypothetical protein